MRQFIIKMGGIVMLLATVLLVENFITGGLGILAALALIPACGMAAWRLLAAGARSKERRRRATRRARPAHRANAQRALRVVEGGGHGPRAA